MIFKEFGDTAKSISNFQTCVEQDPRYYDAYMQLGLLFSKKKDKLALDYFDNALSIDSSKIEVKYGIAMYYQEVSEYEKALEIYRGLVVEFPQDERPYYNTGYVYYKMRNLAKAKSNFERAIKVDPTYADAYYMLGLCAEDIRDYKTAQSFYRQTLNLEPKHDLATKGYKRMEQLL
jgi:tetratricopeptide (TPR) repeat protein